MTVAVFLTWLVSLLVHIHPFYGTTTRVNCARREWIMDSEMPSLACLRETHNVKEKDVNGRLGKKAHTQYAQAGYFS
jgi:hypothetical protein